MSEAENVDRSSKQNFIIENVDPSNYEEFHEFCNDEAGQIDIDGWSFEFVQELVNKFNKQQEKDAEKEGEHERSFANYQSNPGEEIDDAKENPKTQVVLEEIEESENSEKDETNKPEPEITKINQHFNQLQEKPVPQLQVNEVSHQHNKPTNENDLQIIRDSRSEYSKSFFDSSNFWDVPNTSHTDVIKENNFEFIETSNAEPNAINFSPDSMLKKESSNDHKKTEATDSHKVLPESNLADQNKTQKETNNKNDFSAFVNSVEQPKKGSPGIMKNESAISSSSTIRLKEIKEFIPNSPSVFSSTLLSPKSKTLKEAYKGQKIFKIDFIDAVSCVRSSKRPNLSNENLRVEIRSFETVQRSIFASNYLMYNVTVFPSQTLCKRNYQDFEKFRSTLEKFYPGIQLPYLEKDKGTNDEHANKQTQMLEYFMIDVLLNVELRNSRITEEFLSLQDHKKMKRKFEEYEKMSKPKAIEEMCLIDGKVEIALTENERVYNESMSMLLPKIEANFEKYRKHCEILTTQYHQTMSTILNIDSIIKEIQRDVEEFNRGVVLKEIEGLEGSLKKMRDQFKENYFRLKFEKSIIEEQVLPFFRYEKENIHTSKDILDSSNSLTQKYLKRLLNEGINLKDSYLSETNSTFKQGIREESKSILVLKYQAGYMQNQASSELHRILESLGTKIDNKWKQIGSSYLDQLAKSINIWSSIA